MSGSIVDNKAKSRARSSASSTRMSLMTGAKKAGFMGALSSFFVAVIGGSVLNMPRDFVSAGAVLGLVLLFLVALLDHENCRVIVMATDLFRKAGGESYNGMEDLGLLGGKLFWTRYVGKASASLFGNFLYYTISGIAFVDLLLTAFSKIILFTNSALILVGLFGFATERSAIDARLPFGIPFENWVLTVLVFSAYVIVCFIDNVEFLARISWVGSTCMFSIIALVIGGSAWHIFSEGESGEFRAFPTRGDESLFASVGTLYGLYIFSYAGVETYLYQLRGMKDPSNGLNVSLWGHVIAGTVYALVCIFGMLAFKDIGNNIHESDGMPRWITGTVAALLLVANWPAFLCFYLPAVEVVESWFGIKKGILRTGMRIAILLTLSILAMFAEKQVDTVQAITGNLTTGSLCMFFPFAIYWMLKLGLDNENTRDLDDVKQSEATPLVDSPSTVDTSPLRTKIMAGVSFAAFLMGMVLVIPTIMAI